MDKELLTQVLIESVEQYFLTGAIHRMNCPGRYDTRAIPDFSSNCVCGLYKIKAAIKTLKDEIALQYKKEPSKSVVVESCGSIDLDSSL